MEPHEARALLNAALLKASPDELRGMVESSTTQMADYVQMQLTMAYAALLRFAPSREDARGCIVRTLDRIDREMDEAEKQDGRAHQMARDIFAGLDWRDGPDGAKA